MCKALEVEVERHAAFNGILPTHDLEHVRAAEDFIVTEVANTDTVVAVRCVLRDSHVVVAH